MSADHLKNLLKAADATANWPSVVPENVAQRVRARAQRRRRVRQIGNIAAALVLAIGLTRLWGIPANVQPEQHAAGVSETSEAKPVAEPAHLLAEIAELDQRAGLHAQLARQISIVLELDRKAGIRRASLPDDPLVKVRYEAERTAHVLVHQADYLCDELKLCQSAAVKYKRVIDLFPNSPWAGVARQRLAEINEKEGGLS